MALSAKLQVKQTQSLVITPQLMQAIRLLQMSGLELERFVAAELEQNPLLESDDGPTPDDGDSGEIAEAEASGEETLAGEIAADSPDASPDDVGPSPSHSSMLSSRVRKLGRRAFR